MLPLPSPPAITVLKNLGSFKSSNGGGPIVKSGSLPFPQLGGELRKFSYDEISAALPFSVDHRISEGISSTVYKATLEDGILGSKKIEAAVTQLRHSLQGLKEFVYEVNVLVSLQHPNLCKLLGFHAQEGSDERMLIFERLYHGNLDLLLHGSSDGPSIDWCARAMSHEFSASNIQVDKDFSAKLSGYGRASYKSETSISNSSITSVDLSLETSEKRLLTPKSNVWSFGIVLLELLTGRNNLDTQYPNEERGIIKWSRPFLDEDCRLLLIIDPHIKGRCPPKAARTVADIVPKCHRKDPSQRPTMRTIVESLENVSGMKHPSRYPLQEPSVVSRKQMLKSQSMNGITIPTPQVTTNISPSPPSRSQPLLSPRVSLSILLPHRTCSTTRTVSVERFSIVSIFWAFCL